MWLSWCVIDFDSNDMEYATTVSGYTTWSKTAVFLIGTTSARMTQHPQFPQNPFVFPPTWAQQIMFPPMHGMNPTSQCFPAMYDKSLETPGLQQAPLNSSQVDASRMPSGKQYRSESMPHTPVPMYHPAASSSWHQNIFPHMLMSQ